MEATSAPELSTVTGSASEAGGRGKRTLVRDSSCFYRCPAPSSISFPHTRARCVGSGGAPPRSALTSADPRCHRRTAKIENVKLESGTYSASQKHLPPIGRRKHGNVERRFLTKLALKCSTSCRKFAASSSQRPQELRREAEGR
ncbi:Hypothetical protein SMAX5B_020934 [Scophthalmus maximus]|uniref:Uncharacterized protein n=1 Tax=Scophthalmus maximus TaxID=52904 RepID=A0A2U9CQL2_SCOMX|nr:Hypothetical protein SMAX5B_020934 [Scophthalmus maximus]